MRELLDQARASVPAALELAEAFIANEALEPRVRLEAAKFLTAYGLGAPPRDLPKDPIEDLSDEELTREVAKIIPAGSEEPPGTH